MQAGAWWMIAALLAYIAQMVSIIWMEHRRQSHLVAWIFIVMVCPFLGYAAYWIIGRRLRRVPRRELPAQLRVRAAQNNSDQMPASGEDDRVDAFVKEHLPYAATHNNRARVLTNGEDTFSAILEAISNARHHVHLDYYTIRSDGIGRRFLEVLTAKAKAGVEVRLLYDGIGSLKLEEAYLQELDRCGVQHACFSPPGESLMKRRLNDRNHRKIVVVDGRIGFLGGINIGDEYLGLDKRLGYWRDTHLRLEGASVHQLQQIFAENWHRATNTSFFQEEDAGERSYYMPAPAPVSSGDDRVVLVPGKPGIHDQIVAEALFVAIADARRSIFATTPYFIPDPAIAASLRVAARSGLDVRLIIPGISDSKLVLLATLSYIQDMLDAGVKVYRYGKGFIHAKVMIIDGRVASIGSANLDMRSLYSNYEILALIDGEKPVSRLLDDFMEDIANSEPLDPVRFAGRPAKVKAAETLMRLLSPLL